MSFELIVLIILGIAGFYAYKQFRRWQQRDYIEQYRFNSVISKRVQGKYPHLNESQIDLVMQALRDYFYICNQAKRKMVSMPSQVVDVAWHEFILCTRLYQQFCKKGFGRFLHHTPTEAMRSPTMAQEGIKRAWRLTCVKSNINPRIPHELPLLFAIDTMLDIEDGFRYSLNCKDKTSPVYGDGYCAGHIGCASGCGGDTGSVGTASDGGSGGFFGGGDGDSGAGCGGGD